MLPDETREALAAKVEEYFGSSDEGLRAAALRLQDDGHWEVDIFNILRAAFRAGYDEGHADAKGEEFPDGLD